MSKVSDNEMTEFKQNLITAGFTAEDLRKFNADPLLMNEWIELGRELFSHEWYKPFESVPTHQWREVAGKPDVTFMLAPQREPWNTHDLKVQVRQSGDKSASTIVHKIVLDEWTTVAGGVQMRKKYPRHLNIEIRLRRLPGKD